MIMTGFSAAERKRGKLLGACALTFIGNLAEVVLPRGEAGLPELSGPHTVVLVVT